MSVLKVKRLNEKARLPERATAGSAGYDLRACIEQPMVIEPGQVRKIPSGLAIELADEHHVAIIFARSSMVVKHGVRPANAVGVIDSEYRGEGCIFRRNYSDCPYTVEQQDRVARLLVMPVALPEVQEVEQLSDPVRGEGGFGSTGK